LGVMESLGCRGLFTRCLATSDRCQGAGGPNADLETVLAIAVLSLLPLAIATHIATSVEVMAPERFFSGAFDIAISGEFLYGDNAQPLLRAAHDLPPRCADLGSLLAQAAALFLA
jgi:hypothetical protein